MPSTGAKAVQSKTLTKREVIELLGKSKRTVETYIASGRLACEYFNGPNGKTGRFKAEDVAELKRNIDNPIPRIVKTIRRQREPKAAPPPAVALPPPDYWADVARAVAALAPAPQRPWLTLDEASAALGLTRKWLLAEAEAGARNGAILDMGKGARGGRWRFSRSALAK